MATASWLYGESDVTEGYDERAGEYTIDVQVKNRLLALFLLIRAGLRKGCHLMNKWHLMCSIVLMSCFLVTRLTTAPIPEFLFSSRFYFFFPLSYTFYQEEKKRQQKGLIGFIMKAFPVAALCATGAFIYHSLWLALGWLFFTMILALFGFTRLLKRGLIRFMS